MDMKALAKTLPHTYSDAEVIPGVFKNKGFVLETPVYQEEEDHHHDMPDFSLDDMVDEVIFYTP